MKCDILSEYITSGRIRKRGLDKMRFLIERYYSRYESINGIYLVKKKTNHQWQLKKYPRVIFIPLNSGKWIVPHDPDFSFN